MRLLIALILAAALSGCSMLSSDASGQKKGFTLWPFGEQSGEDATAYLEYQRTLEKGTKPSYTVSARNTHVSRTISGQLRTTTEGSAYATQIHSESFTLLPNEQKPVLTYPANTRVTYEVTATFQ
jgi:hypothetical protein